MWNITLVLFSYFGFSSASLFNHHEALGMACGLAAQNLFTTCNQEDFDCFCASGLYIYSVETCIAREAHYNSTLMGMAFDKFESKFCMSHGAHANVTDAWSSENQRLNPIVTERAYKLAYEGEKNNMEQKQVSLYLGLGLIFYWVAALGLVMVSKLTKRVLVRLFAWRMVMRRASVVERWLQRKLIWPAMFNSRHMSPYEYFRGWISFSLPTRFEGVVASGYFLLAVIFMLTPYTIMNNDPLFDSRWKELMRYASDRSGIMATVQFPLIVLFALRNNILQWLCGWSYSTFNTYHRAVSRVNYMLLIVHAVMKHIFSASYGGSLVKYYYPVPYFRWGCAAIGLLSLMVMFAIIRGRCYEWFYRLHQLMALGGIICSIFHLDGLGFKSPLYISLALWGVDWAIRIARIFIFNINMFFPPLPGAHQSTYATARVYDGYLLRLTITTPVRWVFKPGQYVFLHTNRWTFIGGHPFSVVGSSQTGEGLELTIKARSGLTKKLHKALDDRSCSPKYPVTIPVYIEGPYGQSAPVKYYEEGLFFAGGIGITGIFGYLEEMAKSNLESDIPKKIRLFWAIRSRNEIDPIAHRLARLSKMEGVYIRIFQRPTTARLNSAFESALGGKDLEGRPKSCRVLVKESMDNSGGIIKLGRSDRIETANKDNPSKLLRQNNDEWMRDKFTQIELEQPNEAILSTHANSNRSSREKSKEGKPKSHSKNSSITNHFRKPSALRYSFVDFIKSRNPDDDDTFDYGKKEFLKQDQRNKNGEDPSDQAGETSTILGSSSSRNSREVKNDSNRYRCSAFSEAGFTDAFTDRQMIMVNPFDERLYSFGSTLEKQQDPHAEVYNMIEPIGMDVASLIEHHFKNSDGSICVVGCGPNRMMDTLCWSCCEFLETATHSRVDYYEEAFKW